MKMMLRTLLMAALLLPSASFAKDKNQYEITPYLGWRTSSSLEETATGAKIDLDETGSYGLILSYLPNRSTTYDLLFSTQDTNLRLNTPPVTENLQISYLHLGGTVYYPQNGMLPFVAGGLGATHVDPANSLYSSETKFSFSIGGGLLVPFHEQIGLRLEARGFGTVYGGSGSILCSGGCIASFTGSVFWQVELLAGLSIRF